MIAKAKEKDKKGGKRSNGRE